MSRTVLCNSFKYQHNRKVNIYTPLGRLSSLFINNTLLLPLLSLLLHNEDRAPSYVLAASLRSVTCSLGLVGRPALHSIFYTLSPRPLGATHLAITITGRRRLRHTHHVPPQWKGRTAGNSDTYSFTHYLLGFKWWKFLILFKYCAYKMYTGSNCNIKWFAIRIQGYTDCNITSDDNVLDYFFFLYLYFAGCLLKKKRKKKEKLFSWLRSVFLFVWYLDQSLSVLQELKHILLMMWL